MAKTPDFWDTFTSNKLLLTLTVTYILTGTIVYYFDLLPWSHKDSDDDNTPEEAIKEVLEKEEAEDGLPTDKAKNFLFKNKVIVYYVLGWLGFISLMFAWLSKTAIGDAIPSGYLGTLLKLITFTFAIFGLIGLTFYFISYTPLTLTGILSIINLLIIGGGLTIIFESTGKSTSALLAGLLGAILGGLMGGLRSALIVMIIGGIIGALLGVKTTGTVDPRTAFIKTLLAYIPCFFISIVDYIKHEFNITTSKVWMLLALEMVILGLRVLLPILYTQFNKLITTKGNILVKSPVYLNNVTSLGIFQSAQQVKDNNYHEPQIFNYNYALSLWLWISPHSAATSPAYTKPTSILNFGDILKINFNRDVIEIYAATTKDSINPEQLIKVYELKKIEYQRWNNFIVNYSGGTLDIFINNSLVSSTPNITPITQFEKATAGAVNGIYGGIKNIVYYEHTLSRRQINVISKG